MARVGLLTFAMVCALAATSAFGEERPTLGLLYNTSENHSLRYDCKLIGLELECSFVQIAVRRKARPEELPAALQKARNDFPAFKKDMANQCKGVDALYDFFVLSRVPPGTDMAKLSSIPAGQKADFGKIIQSWRDVCRTPTEENFLEFARSSHDRDTRTCHVSANPYTQRLRRVDSSGPWVVADAPSGPCGIVNVSRFEADRGVTTGLTFWRYHAKKVITNPKGQFFAGASCSGLDEREYIYDWKSQEAYLGCDYINFSAL